MRTAEDQKLIDLLLDTLIECNMLVSGRQTGTKTMSLSERLMHVIRLTDETLMTLPPPSATRGNAVFRTQYLQWRKEIARLDKKAGETTQLG